MFLFNKIRNQYAKISDGSPGTSCARNILSESEGSDEEEPDLLYSELKCTDEEFDEETYEALLMKPKRLEWMLSELRGFENPDIKLEQYGTSPELAVAITDCIDRLVGLDGKFVGDLGCGYGMLMSAVALAYEPAAVIGFDIDKHAISTCKDNLEDLEIDGRCDLVRADVLELPTSFRSDFDVILMNPPFGTKNNSGIDLCFVKAGLEMVRINGSVFSLHKTSTREYIFKTVNKWDDTEAECVAQLRLELPATYKFHKKKTVDIKVDLIHYRRV
ncbi:unnamed protein product [Cylicocyclus nassatus]|uniref:Methyltransferase-like protein 5 n=1 Tax=Cylicocyclus nassatus TaxID=53992 RepID=A0AA36GWP5_CYLNA|nr:unnamed protein product [Cylicocyclus nassatus]